MKKRIVLLFLVSSLFFLSISYLEQVSCQYVVAPPIEWQSTVGGFKVEETTDRGFVVFGTKRLSRIDSLGNLVWTQTYSTEFYSGDQCLDGGYVLAGDTSLVKTDEVGVVQWERDYEESGFLIRFKAVQQTSDGGFVLAGWKIPNEVNNDDFYLVKTDSSGNVEWKKTFGAVSANELAYDVLESTDGGYVLVGEKISFGEIGMAGLIMKTDKNGNLQWSKTYGENNSFGDRFYCINPTNDGGYIISGCANSNPGSLYENGNFWLLQTDNSGNQQLNRQFNKIGHESASSAIQTDDGFFVAVGDIWLGSGIGDTWIIKTNLYDGSILWDKIIEETGVRGNDIIKDIIQTDDRGFAFVAGDLRKIMRANPPVSRFSYSIEKPTVKQEIFFDASSSFDLDEDIVSYLWDFSDGNITTTTTANISHSFELPRNYDVKLTVIDSEELNSTFSNEIWVKINSSITLFTDTATSYAGKPIQISGRLIDANGDAITNEIVSLHYGDNRKENWTPLEYAITDSTGNFVSIWTPSNPRDYSIKGEWKGNQTFYGATNFTDVQILSNPVILSLSLSSTSTEFGFKIGINGKLTSNEVGLEGFPIHLSYSVTEGKTWNDISLKKTNSEGKYSVEWMPTATGDYLVRALWTGNSSYPRRETTANLVVLSFEENTVFSVASNSTISSLTFNSITKELKFNLSGVNGTKGYVDACISKTLIEDINEVQVYLDDTPVEYNFSSIEDSWLVSFSYNHSSHETIIYLSATAMPDGIPNGNPLSNLDVLPILLVTLVILICGIVVYFNLRKRK